MSDCNSTVNLIYDTDNIGESLYKINNNFEALQTLACDIEKTLDKDIAIRTFFYYGPNSATESGSGMQDGQTSYPSTNTIETFINNTLQLSAISEVGDLAYVIYQKTGWTPQNVITQRSGSGTVPYSRAVTVPVQRKIGIGRWRTDWVTQMQTFYAGYTWSADINDQYNLYAPVIIIYKLYYNGTGYSVNANYPKFTRASTNTTANWNNPTAWSIY